MEDLVYLQDDKGHSLPFEVLDRIEVEGKKYVAIMRYYEDEEEGEEDNELVILEVKFDKEDTYLEPIEDDATFTLLAEIFQERLADRFESFEF